MIYLLTHRIFPKLRICIPPSPHSEVVTFTWKMRTVLNPMKKTIFRFFRYLFFELWLLVFTIYADTPSFSNVSPTKIVQKWPNLQERCAISMNEWKIKFPIFSVWDIINFVLNFRFFYTFGGFCPPKPPVVVVGLVPTMAAPMDPAYFWVEKPILTG